MVLVLPVSCCDMLRVLLTHCPNNCTNSHMTTPANSKGHQVAIIPITNENSPAINKTASTNVVNEMMKQYAKNLSILTVSIVTKIRPENIIIPGAAYWRSVQRTPVIPIKIQYAPAHVATWPAPGSLCCEALHTPSLHLLLRPSFLISSLQPPWQIHCLYIPGVYLWYTTQ